jgi:hypothetical protein
VSAQRPVPSTSARRRPLTWALIVLVIAAAAVAAYLEGRRAGAVHEVLFAVPSGAARVAFVREAPCGKSTPPATARERGCQTLWLGNTREDAREVGSLAPDEVVEDIAWASDGYRMGFLINGYQFRIFDYDSGTQVGQVNLLEPSGVPSERIARGITFSQNGAAVTFDDCPRYKSGCRPALMAVR